MIALTAPSRWRGPSKWMVAGMVFFVAAVPFCLNWAVRALLNGNALTSLVAVGLGVSLCGYAAAGYRLYRRRVIPRATSTSDGTIVEPDYVSRRIMSTTFCGLILSGVLFAVLAPQDKVDLDLSDGQRLFFSIGALLVAILCVPALIGSAFRDGPRIALRRQGVDFYSGRRWTTFQWDEIQAILDYIPEGKSNTGHPITVIATDDRQFTLDTPDSYTPGGTALFWMLRYYWLTSDARDELADGRAVTRYLESRFEMI